jgi:hypothetical protein
MKKKKQEVKKPEAKFSVMSEAEAKFCAEFLAARKAESFARYRKYMYPASL